MTIDCCYLGKLLHVMMFIKTSGTPILGKLKMWFTFKNHPSWMIYIDEETYNKDKFFSQ